MATNKPRITITITENQHRLLRSLSENSGQSMSSFITEFLTVTEPTLERMAATFQRLKQARDFDTKRIADQLQDTQDVLEPLAMQSLDQFDLFLGKIEEAAGVHRPPATAGDGAHPAASTTPPTNRGVTPTHGKPRNPAPVKAPKAVRTRKEISEKGVRKS